MFPKNEIDPELAQILMQLKTRSGRSPENIARGRAGYIRSAEELVKAVTIAPKPRHIGWMRPIQSIFTSVRKERSPMFSVLTTIFLVIAMVAGGGGATVAAAQASLPDQPLYPVKLWSEDIRLGLTADPQVEMDLELKFASRRVEETIAMVQAGSVPPDALLSRFQLQVEEAIRIAAGLPDDQAVLSLEQVQLQLETQLKLLEQVQSNGNPEAEAALVRSCLMIQERLQWVQTGLGSLETLRDRLRQMDQSRDGSQDGLETPGVEATLNSEKPGTAGNGNPWTTGTPTPGSGYGPGSGSGDCLECTPDGNAPGGNPWTDEAPTPGSGYGPGPGDSIQNPPPPDTGAGTSPEVSPEPVQQPQQPPTNPDGGGSGDSGSNPPDGGGSGGSEPNPPGGGGSGGSGGGSGHP